MLDSSKSWDGRNINVVIPMAGLGSRFASAGYTDPKPMIDVNGKPMIQVATDLGLPNATYTFIVQRAHSEKYNFKSFLENIHPNCNVIEIDGLTDGAARTVLKAESIINNEDHLIIANCDQYIDFNTLDFMTEILEKQADGACLNFLPEDCSTKWSYARVDGENYIKEVAEKKVISNIATVGLYHFTKGSDFVWAAKQMIQKDIRVNNEFYVCPVYNELINAGKKILSIFCNEMYGLGTPEDLNFYLTHKS